jgi:hypothetical protein
MPDQAPPAGPEQQDPAQQYHDLALRLKADAAPPAQAAPQAQHGLGSGLRAVLAHPAVRSFLESVGSDVLARFLALVHSYGSAGTPAAAAAPQGQPAQQEAQQGQPQEAPRASAQAGGEQAAS